MFLFSCAYAYVACVMLIAQVWTRLYFLFRFKKIYQTLETVFHRLFKHLEFRQKYPAARRIFESLLTRCSDVAMKRSLSRVWYITWNTRESVSSESRKTKKMWCEKEDWSTCHENSESPTRIEPMTSRTLGGRSIHWATRTHGEQCHLTEFICDRRSAYC